MLAHFFGSLQRGHNISAFVIYLVPPEVFNINAVEITVSQNMPFFTSRETGEISSNSRDSGK